MRVYGNEAIEAKRENQAICLNKAADPIEDERLDISIEEAEEIIREDGIGLLWIEN